MALPPTQTTLASSRGLAPIPSSLVTLVSGVGRKPDIIRLKVSAVANDNIWMTTESFSNTQNEVQLLLTQQMKLPSPGGHRHAVHHNFLKFCDCNSLSLPTAKPACPRQLESNQDHLVIVPFYYLLTEYKA